MLKSTIITAIGLIFSLTVFGQLTGSGTLTSPYSGTLTSDLTITGTKYFGGNIVVDNEKLTLSAGSSFISTSSSACIKIIGTGILYAVGTSSSPILISGDTDKDKINGESTDTWGDIYITSTSASTMSYCTIERGKRTDDRLGSTGGGLYLSGTTINMNNCTIRYCTATKGGGIYVAAGHSPSITNCLFQGNSATDNGGAAYVSSSSSPIFSNDIFYSNTSASSTYKGGAIASVSASPIIVNSVFAYNTAASSSGNAIYLENSTSAIIVNTILWGSSNLVAYTGTTSSVFSSCALQGVSYTGCITLNGTNTATDGPNFTSPTTGDFSITFDSPLRDAGVSTYTGVTIPTTDYIGTKRVGNPDIGAYEMLYSRWTGSVNTDWARPANWDKSYNPGTTRNIIIPAGLTNYPILSPGPSFTLYSGLKMIVEPRAKVTFTSLTNNGTVFLKSDATGTASLITTSFTGTSGSLNVEEYIKGGLFSPDHYNWHYIAPPATVSKTVFTNIGGDNLLMYDESKVTSTMFTGWQWHDGYDNTTGFLTLNAKSGYDIYINFDTVISYNALKTMITSMGQINLSFSGTGKDTSRFGFNLIGNSLTCGINWDLVTRSDEALVTNAIYVTIGDTIASYVDGVGILGASAHIAPLQGFFVKANASGTYITIPNTAKEHYTTTILKSTSSKSLLRLSLTCPGKNSVDETIIRLDDNATKKFDGKYDAYKISSPKGQTMQLYSIAEGIPYSINTIPWPESQTIIPLILVLPSSGTYKISRTQIQNFNSYTAYLTDNLTNTVLDLSSINDYTFTAESGTLSGRFTLTVSNKYPKKSYTESNQSIKAYRSENEVCLIPLGEEWNGEKCSVRLYDLSGKLLFTSSNENLYNGELKEFYPGNVHGPIIVEVIKADGTRYSKKVAFTPNK